MHLSLVLLRRSGGRGFCDGAHSDWEEVGDFMKR